MPATSDNLLTIVHISDLHIGEIDPTTGNAVDSRAAQLAFSNSSWFDGLLGHHKRGLEELKILYNDIRDQEGAPLLVVSGDLTRFGDGSQFDAANEFIGSSIEIQPGRFIGLHAGARWRDYAIPGNHDHWPGAPRIVGRATAGFQTYFPSVDLPYVHAVNLSGGRSLVVIGIDTCSEVGPFSLERIYAIGRFQLQLTHAEAKLNWVRQPGEIRALILHHSWLHAGRYLFIEPATRNALGRFLVNNGIQVILTGHIHEPDVQPFRPGPGADAVWECRCGTTTQLDDVPYHWRTLGGGPLSRSWPWNSLLVHRIVAQSDKTVWKVEVFTRTRTQGFRTAGIRRQFDV